MSRRAVILGRVSRGERQQNPESQLAPLRAAAARLGWTVGRELPLKLSAWDADAAGEVRRQALAPMIAGQTDTLMVLAWDSAPSVTENRHRVSTAGLTRADGGAGQ